MDDESLLIESGEVDQVCDQTFEASRFDTDHPDRVLGPQHTLVESLRVAADRRERRLQLVAHRQQERALGSTGAGELARHRIERFRETAHLGRPCERERLGLLAVGETTARARDSQHGPGDVAGEHRSHRHREEAADRACGDEREPERPALGAHGACSTQEQHDVGAARPGGVEVFAVVDRDPAGWALRQKQPRLFLRKDQEPFVLRREKAAELPGGGVQVLVREQCDLALEPVVPRMLERPSYEVRADDQRDRYRREHGRADREPQACLKRHHASRAALLSRMRYPTPRTVWIRSGRPSFFRSCATWTSTVRVPPANDTPQTRSSSRPRVTTWPGWRASSARSSNSSVRSVTVVPSIVTLRLRRSTRRPSSSIIRSSDGAGSARRRIARTRATSSRGENGFVM